MWGEVTEGKMSEMKLSMGGIARVGKRHGGKCPGVKCPRTMFKSGDRSDRIHAATVRYPLFPC